MLSRDHDFIWLRICKDKPCLVLSGTLQPACLSFLLSLLEPGLGGITWWISCIILILIINSPRGWRRWVRPPPSSAGCPPPSRGKTQTSPADKIWSGKVTMSLIFENQNTSSFHDELCLWRYHFRPVWQFVLEAENQNWPVSSCIFCEEGLLEIVYQDNVYSSWHIILYPIKYIHITSIALFSISWQILK